MNIIRIHCSDEAAAASPPDLFGLMAGVERVSIGVPTEVAIVLGAGAPVFVGVSGGRDWQALAYRVCAHLDDIGHQGQRFLIHADLGRLDWRDSLPVCERQAHRLGVDLVVVRRNAGDMMDRWLSRWTGNRWLDLWYHFAIMFEALFILTTVDAGTRVGRYILQDFLGNIWKPLGDTKKLGPNLLASGLMVAGWGMFLIQGVRDPLGGINSLWPLFGIANQMLAAIALCLATTIILKMQLTPHPALSPSDGERVAAGRVRGIPALAIMTLVPLVWLLSVTFTAGIQKVWHQDPRIGFITGAASAQQKREALRATIADIPAAEAAAMSTEIATLAKQVFNLRLDAGVAIGFLVLVSVPQPRSPVDFDRGWWRAGG